MLYGYDDLLRDLENFGGVFSIGKSLFGRELFACVIGDGEPRALIHAGIHARESVTSAVLVETMKAYKGRALCFVPMLNPDGAMLVKYGVESADENYREFLLAVNGGKNFSLWKADGRAVDLNVNFNADWGEGGQNVRQPASENYIGPAPFSESETIAIKNLQERYMFTASMSLHTKGNILYYGYKNCNNYIKYVKIIAASMKMPYSESAGSAGGFKDWFIKSGFGFSVTAELGSDRLSHPINSSYAAEFSKTVLKSAGILADIGEELWKKNS